MNKLYNKQEFASLVSRAVGNTMKRDFARLIDVSPEYLSRILNCKLANPPSIQVIQLIANNASNGVTMKLNSWVMPTMEDTATLMPRIHTNDTERIHARHNPYALFP